MKYQIDVSKVKKIQGNIWDQIKSTFSYRTGYGRALPIFGHYGGVFSCGKEKLVIHADGVGTKVILAQEMDKYDTIGIDAMAMSANDILCLGAESLTAVDYIGLAKEDDYLVNELVKGLVIGAKEAKCSIIGGETAIIPEIICGSKRPFDLAVTLVGRIKKLIRGDKIKKNQLIIGLESSGLHSNGYTLARKILPIKDWGEQMLEPTKIYCNSVLEMIDKCKISGIAHITGGAFSKISRLNSNIGYHIEKFESSNPLFKELQKSVKEDREMYRTFNMGIGMCIIADKSESEKIMKISKKHRINAQIIGNTSDKKGVWLKDNGKEISLS